MFRLSLVNEMETMQQELNQLFHGLNFSPTEAARHPQLNFNISDQGESFDIKASLPGLVIETLGVEILGRQLVVSGEFAPAEQTDKIRYQRQERHAGAFTQELLLSADINNEKVVAAYRQGVLQITLPKAASALPQKIALNIS